MCFREFESVPKQYLHPCLLAFIIRSLSNDDDDVEDDA